MKYSCGEAPPCGVEKGEMDGSGRFGSAGEQCMTHGAWAWSTALLADSVRDVWRAYANYPRRLR